MDEEGKGEAMMERHLLINQTHRNAYIKDLMIELYKEGYLQTLWNARNKENAANGWILKDGSWSPWFFNMRPVGSSPELFNKICSVLALMAREHDINFYIGIEMAGIPYAGGLSVLAYQMGKQVKIGYTRPLPQKARTTEECLQIYEAMDKNPAGYGQKSYVEAVFSPGDRVAVLDDMSTGLTSKIIARYMTLKEALRQNVEITCDLALYFLNRNKSTRAKAEAFMNEADYRLFPRPLTIDYFIEFDDHLSVLAQVMRPHEYGVIQEFQRDPSIFQDPQYRRKRLDGLI
jgi:orotate phosphoribosyltransferase